MSLDVTVVVVDEGRIVLIERADFRLWALPGGRVEQGETAAQAAIREVREETGLEVALTGLVRLYARPDWIDNNHSVVFAARPRGGVLSPQPGEADDVRFFPADRLPEHLNWFHRQPIRDAIAGVGGSAVWRQGLRWPPELPSPEEVFALRARGPLPEPIVRAGRAAWCREPRPEEQRREVEE